jgi:hypothetical protein
VLFQLCMAAAVANLVLMLNAADFDPDGAATFVVSLAIAVTILVLLVVDSRAFRHSLLHSVPTRVFGGGLVATARHPRLSVKTAHIRPAFQKSVGDAPCHQANGFAPSLTEC